MKKILAIIFLVGLFGNNAKAQIRRPTDSTQNVVSGSSKSAERHETLNSLNLTKQQLDQLREFRRNMKQRRDSINNDQSLNEEQKQRKLKELPKEQQEKLKSILTPEQMEKLKVERMKTRQQKSN